MTSDTYFFLASAILVFICASALASDACACNFLSSTLSRNELPLKTEKNTTGRPLLLLHYDRKTGTLPGVFNTLKLVKYLLGVNSRRSFPFIFCFEISSAQPCLFLQSLLGDYYITGHLHSSKGSIAGISICIHVM